MFNSSSYGLEGAQNESAKNRAKTLMEFNEKSQNLTETQKAAFEV